MKGKRSIRAKKAEIPERSASAGKVQRRFKLIAREIREGRANGLGEDPRSRLPNEKFKRSAYKLISYYVENEWHHVFALVLSELDRIPKTSIQPNENPFFWGLAAICGEETVFSMNQLRRVAKGMHEALERGVPECEVIEFLNGLNRRAA